MKVKKDYINFLKENRKLNIDHLVKCDLCGHIWELIIEFNPKKSKCFCSSLMKTNCPNCKNETYYNRI